MGCDRALLNEAMEASGGVHIYVLRGLNEPIRRLYVFQSSRGGNVNFMMGGFYVYSTYCFVLDFGGL